MDIHLDRDTDRNHRRQPVRRRKGQDNRRKRGVLVLCLLLLAGAIVAAIFLVPKWKDYTARRAEERAATQSQTTAAPTPYTGFVETDAITGKSVNARFSADKYTEKTMAEADLYSGDLILVNNNHAYHFDKAAFDKVNMFGQVHCGLRTSDMEICRDVVEPLNRMLDDFKAATGLKTLMINSAYRTYEAQETLFNDKVASVGEAQAKKLLSLPGYTEHHTGLSFDFQVYDNGKSYDYTGLGDYAWIGEHCSDYGLIVRYTAKKTAITGINSEPWHFRYVGVPHASIMAKRNLCLEEYIDELKHYTFGKNHMIFTQDDVRYEIYYTPSTTLQVPTDAEYRISGNNIDGFIVTVSRPVETESESQAG